MHTALLPLAMGLLLYVGACDKQSPSATTSEDAESAKRSGAKESSRKKMEQKKRPKKAAEKQEGSADGEAGTPKELVRRPTVPDPHKGTFSVAKSLDGLSDTFRSRRSMLIATIETSKGTLKCELYPDKAPLTVANFIGLARGTRPWWDARDAKWVKRPYYEGSTFHRVIPGFMIQGGDYLGDGSGGVGYEIPDEVDASLRHNEAGQLCMANRGPNTNGGQFFITDAAAPHLDGGYTIFGQCSPASLVSMIAQVPQAGPPTNRPTTPVIIRNIDVAVEPRSKGTQASDPKAGQTGKATKKKTTDASEKAAGEDESDAKK